MAKGKKTEAGHVFGTEHAKFTKEEAEKLAKEVSELSFDPHAITTKIIEFGKALTGVPIYDYQYAPIYRIIYSVITVEGTNLTMIFARQSGKCFAKDTEVLMYDLSTKKIQDVQETDLVMGPDSKPRKVLSLARGQEQMYEVSPRTKYGKKYTVNESHIMAFKERLRDGTLLTRTASIKEYLEEPKWKRKDAFVGYRAPLKFPEKEVAVHPYFLGLWLGDGNNRDLQITTMDAETVSFLEEYASSLGYTLSEYQSSDSCYSYAISCGQHGGQVKNSVLEGMRGYSLINNKHIPRDFIKNTREVRLNVLAGLIDSDGHKPAGSGKENVCEITFKDKVLAEDTVLLARSLGFRATIYEKIATIKDIGYSCLVHRICIYGDLYEIPTKISRKKYKEGILRENPTTYGFDIIKKEVDDYYGFEVDGDNLFLLDDLTVVHNSEAVAFTINTLCVILPVLSKFLPELDQYKDGIKIGLFAPQKDQVDTTYGRALDRLGSENAELVMSDPEIGAYLESDRHLRLSNGSYLKGQVAAKQSKIESKTYDLVFIEEAQDMNDFIVRKSIEPMITATSGTIVKVGTTGTVKGDFWYDIQENRRMSRKEKDPRLTLHFENDYKKVIASKRKQYNEDKKLFHLNYEKDVLKKRRRWGEDSDAFRLSYALIWALDSGMFVTDKDWDVITNKKKGFPKKVLHDWHIVAGLDIAKSQASTVLTIVKVFDRADTEYEEAPMKEVIHWLELSGEDYETQHHLIMDALVEWKVEVLYADYTGVGRPVVDRLMYACGDHVSITPYTFTRPSKSDMWQALLADIRKGRLVIPANRTVRETPEFRKFEEQMKSLQKWYEGSYLVAEKGTDSLDDFCDSIALAVMAGNTAMPEEIEDEDFNPFFDNRNLDRSNVRNYSW